MKKMLIFLVALAMVFNASAFEIQTPEHATYNSSAIDLLINHTDALDSIIYQLDSTSPVLACTDCAEYSDTLDLNEGTHTLHAWGEKNGTSYSDSVSFTVQIPEESKDFSLEILTPEEDGNYSGEVFLSVFSNMTLDRMRYKVDSSAYQTLCTDCAQANKTLSLNAGEHTITVKGDLDGELKTISTTFNVVKNTTFTLQIVKPTSKTYDIGAVPFEIKSNTTLDKISIKVGDYEKHCDDCAKLTGEVDLAKGSYSLKATGLLGDITKETTVWFKVANLSNEDNGDGTTDRNRYGLGFEKLPQMLEAGEITDAELAKIIKNNQLNPGVMNRLIKTGKLGDESIDAILKYYVVVPKGIWMKFMSFVGFHHSYSEDIYKYYGKNKNVTKKLASSEDLPKGIAKKIQQDLNDDMEEMMNNVQSNGNNNDNQNGNHPNSLTVGKEKPFNDSKLSGSGKIPPGQAKKQVNSFWANFGKGNGKGKN